MAAPNRWRIAWNAVLGVLSVAYALALACIGFWPVPVDRGSRGLVDAIIAAVPVLNYSRLEFGANVVLFLPFGLLLAAALPRPWRWLTPIAGAAASCCIEVGQAMLLAERTPALRDVIANTLGATIGMLVVIACSGVARLGERVVTAPTRATVGPSPNTSSPQPAMPQRRGSSVRR